MKKRIWNKLISILTAILLVVEIVPNTTITALVVDAPATLYVGNQQVISGTETTYWSTNNSGEITQSAENNAWNVKYDPNTVTLTLKNATIEGVYNNVNTSGSGIYAASSSGPVSLNIVLEEENKVSGMYGIDVSSSGGDASLNISGSGSLTVSGLSGNGIGIFMSSQNSANLTIEEASVTALGSQDGGSGVRLITSQTGSPSLTIEVKGGSLQASGETNGIHFLSNVNDATAVANLKVSGNATVKASNIITTKDGTGSAPELKPAASGSDGTGGIIWDGKNGTVYGKVELKEDLEIGEGESLTIGKDASLNTGSHEVIVNGGTLTGGDKITGTVKYAPSITTEFLPEGKVNEEYATSLSANGSEPITWSVTNGSLPDGLTLNTNTGEITGTPTTASSYPFTVKAENDYGSKTKELTININDAKTYSVSVTPDKITLPSVKEGYDPQVPEYITIKNTGNQTIKLEDHGANPWLIITLDKNTLEPNEEAKVSIKLKDGLSAEKRSTLYAFITYTSEDGSYRDHARFEVTYEVRHDMKHIEAKAATHLEEGNIKYWYCEYCDKYYKGALGTDELSLEDITIPKLSDHTATDTWYHDEKSHYHTCECGEVLDKKAHDFKWVIDKEATATSTGLKHEECSICGYKKDSVIIPVLEIEVPNTGVRSNTSIFTVIALLSLSALTGTVIYQRKKKEN